MCPCGHPRALVFDECSAGIDVFGFAQGNVVLNNSIRGRARAALAVATGGISVNDAFVLNRFDEFEASLADVLVSDGVTNTLVAGRGGTVEDHGVGTVIGRCRLRRSTMMRKPIIEKMKRARLSA